MTMPEFEGDLNEINRSSGNDGLTKEFYETF